MPPSPELSLSSHRGPISGNHWTPIPCKPPLGLAWKAKAPKGGFQKMVLGWGRCYLLYGKTGITCLDSGTCETVWDRADAFKHGGIDGDLFLASPTHLWVTVEDDGPEAILRLVNAETGMPTDVERPGHRMVGLTSDKALLCPLFGQFGRLVNRQTTPVALPANDAARSEEQTWWYSIGSDVAIDDDRFFGTCTVDHVPDASEAARQFMGIDIGTRTNRWTIDGFFHVVAASEHYLVLRGSFDTTAPPELTVLVEKSSGKILWQKDEIAREASVVEPHDLVVTHVSRPYEHEVVGTAIAPITVCRDLATGDTVWESEGAGQGHAVTNDVVWSVLFRDEKPHLIARDLRTGEESWATKIIGQHTFLTATGDGCLFTLGGKTLTCYAGTRGSESAGT